MDEPSAHKRNSLTPLRLLIASSSAAEIELIYKVLAQSGYEAGIDHIDSAECYRKQLLRNDYDVILCDHTLGGWEPDAIEMLKQSGKRVPFIVVTGALGDDAAIGYIKRGAADFVHKDYLLRLPLVIQRALDERKLRLQQGHAQKILRESEARYRGLFENASYGIFQSTVEGRFIDVNPALVSMLGYQSKDDLLRVNMAELFCDPEARNQLIERSAELQCIDGFEARWMRRDGSPLLLRFTGRSLLDKCGKVHSLEVVVEDITARRKLEQQLLQAQKLEAIGLLAGGVAHDFNNLLGVILGYSELLINIYDFEPLCSKLQKIKAAGDRAATLTNQLLAVSRKQVMKPQLLDINTIVSEVKELLLRLIGEDIELVTKLDPTLGRIKSDPGQLEQVIMNLAVNARDAMPRGGKLTIETANLDIAEADVSAHTGVAAGAYILLRISDTGIGIPASVQSHIFDPFFTTKEEGKGTGLGLATVYGIVKQNNGAISVSSEINAGTCFTIYLPRQAPGAILDPVKPATLNFETSRATETILYVEDSAPLRALTRELLENRGYCVLEAGDGAEAIAIAEQYDRPIDLLLTDVVMPGISGRELAQRLAPIRTDMRVLYTSGYTADAVLRHGVCDHGVGFVQKPFRAADLERKIREALTVGAQTQTA